MKITRLVALAVMAISPAVVPGGLALATPQPSTTLTAPAPTPSAPTTPAPALPAAAPTPARAPVAPAAAPAPPAASTRLASFELVDRGDTVEIIAHNIKAARTAILPIRSRLEVPIVGAPIVKRLVPTDPTVKLIELDGDDPPRTLSVKLGFERADVRTLSRFAQAIQVGDDLHLLVPRKIPADGVVPRVPDPTLTPALAAAVAHIEPPAAPLIGPKADPAAAKIDARSDGKPDGKLDANSGATPGAILDAPAAALDAKIARAPQPDDAKPGALAFATKPTAEVKPLKPSLASDGGDSWSKIAMYAFIGLVALGVGVWLMRRRRAQLAPPASIEIIAQRSLGGRARIVWLSAGQREMIVSVTAQQVRMLGQWRKTDVAAALPAARTYADAGLAARGEPFNAPVRATDGIPVGIDMPVSPAVSGILRLRGRTNQMPIALPDDLASGDVVADELWAKEILAATGARR